MLKLLGVIGGWQGYAAAAILSALISIGTTWYLVSLPYKLTISNMQRDAASTKAASIQNALNQLQSFITNMHTASVQYGKDQDALFAAINQLHNEFTKISSLKPLPPDCKPDADRLRILSAAISAANAATSGRNSGPAMPGTP